ncbi:MAG: tetratricopeptide repeat protein [Bacillota bacterium]
MIKNTIIIIGLAFLFFSCSSSVSHKTVKDTIDSLKNAQRKKEAMDHFVQGAIEDAKGDYSAAILEYQEAIELDAKPGIYYALGRDYLQLNKLSMALQNARQAVAMDSTSPDYYSLLAEIYSSGHQVDSAAYAYEKIISLDSSNINAYFSLGMLYELSKPMQALNVYNKVIEKIGPEWNVLARIAELNERLGNTDEALKTLEQLMTIDPSNFELKKLLIDTYTKSKRYNDALSKINEELAEHPEDPSLHEMKGQIFLLENDWQNAAKEFTSILDNPKVSFDTKVRIGSAYLAQSAQDSTLVPVTKKIFQKLDQDSTSWQVKMVLGEIALREKNDSAAIADFKTVTELAKWNVDAWVRLGGLYYDNKKYQDAADVLTEAVKSFPDSYPVNLLLGLSFSQLNNFQQAKEYLKKSIELNPKDVTALSAMGFVLNQMKQSKEATGYIKEALKVDPNNAELLGTLGMIYNTQKKWSECDSAYTEALKIDSSNVLLLNNYAYSLAERGIRLDEALRMAQTAVGKEPGNSSYLDTYGWVYFKMGNFEKAEEYVRKAIEIDKNNSTLLEHLGDIIYKEGKKNVALEIWQRAYELNSDNPELKSKILKGEL